MYHTIASAAAALRAGATSAADLVEASLAAIATHNPRTNAFTAVHAESARLAARAVDDERDRGIDRGPLHGIPISLKDLIDVAGVPTSAGSRVLDGRVPDVDATIVMRLREAGAIVIGRTNLHEFALGTTSEDSAFGPVHHPRDPDRSPGGSSGGAAAACATGMGLASVGTDTGGSVRIPAAICGLVGLKPSLGEVPTDGIIPLSPSFDHAGPLARTVQDAAWMCDALAGRPYVRVVPVGSGGLRLGLLAGYFEAPLDPTVGHAFAHAIERLRAAGVRITETALKNTSGIMDAYAHIALSEAAAWHATYLEDRRDCYTPVVWARIAHGRTFSAVQYVNARAFCTTLSMNVDAALDACDALVLPTVPIVAPVLGAAEIVVDPDSGERLSVRAMTLKHTQPFNMTGHPAISLPIPSRGLPVGLQLVGRREFTAALVAVAAACEAVLAEGVEGART